MLEVHQLLMRVENLLYIAVMTRIPIYQVTTLSCGVYYDLFCMVAQLKMARTYESDNDT